MEEAAFDEDVETQEAWLVECNIDDMNPKLYGSVLDALFEKEAYDAYLTPVIMKKSRPAVTISILCGAEQLKDIEETLWLQATKYGEVSVKNAYLRGRKIKSKPEYEDCRRLAGEKGVSIKEIYESLSSEDV